MNDRKCICGRTFGYPQGCKYKYVIKGAEKYERIPADQGDFQFHDCGA